jgi:hypothetical protein
MRRLLAASGVAALTLFGPVGVAGATHSEGAGPRNQDFVTGTAGLPDTSLGGDFHFNAYSDPEGDDPRGHYWAKEAIGGLFTFHAVVECLRVFVQPGDATVAIVGTRATRGNVTEGSAQIFRVEDRGEPGTAGDTFSGRPTNNPQDCRTMDVVAPSQQPLENGNFTVHNAAP